MTVSRTIAGWVAMSRTRRIIASLAITAAVGGTTFGACRASDMTGPDFGTNKMGGSKLTSSSNLLPGTSDTDTDSDSDNYPRHDARHEKQREEDAREEVAFRESIETVFPVTEAVYNTCRNELVVLNGHMKQRMRLQTGTLGSTAYSFQTWKDTRGIYGETTVQETYWDDNDKSYKTRSRVVRYHNRETLLDKFVAGPFGIPMQSIFQSRMHLQREGADPLRKVYGDGDDLFVYVANRFTINSRGIPSESQTFRAECN